MFNHKKTRLALVGSLLVISIASFSTNHEALANTTVDESRISAATQQQGGQQTQWAEQNRAAIILNILNRLQAEAQSKGYQDWREELSAFLNKASAQKLLNAYHADSFSEVVEAIRGAKSIQPQAFSAGSAGLSANELLGDNLEDLVFTPLSPCRIVDTRSAGGKFGGTNPAVGTRSYSVNGNAANRHTLDQGGDPSSPNCGVPDGADEPPAVVLNVTSTGGEGNGFLTVWQFGQDRPGASLLNYQSSDIANAAIVPTGLGARNEISVYASARTHVIIDVVGYLRKPEATPLQVTKSPLSSTPFLPITNGNSRLVASQPCPPGFSVIGGEYIWSGAPGPGRTMLSEAIDLSNNRWICEGQNNTGGTVSLRCMAICARTPGH